VASLVGITLRKGSIHSSASDTYFAKTTVEATSGQKLSLGASRAISTLEAGHGILSQSVDGEKHRRSVFYRFFPSRALVMTSHPVGNRARMADYIQWFLVVVVERVSKLNRSVIDGRQQVGEKQ